jgi:hypothetical protein
VIVPFIAVFSNKKSPGGSGMNLNVSEAKARKWIKISIILQFTIILYWEITQYVNLFPYNDVVGLNFHDNFAASLANDVPKIFIIIVFLVGLRWLKNPWFPWFVASSVIYYMVFLGIQLSIWWGRYLFGASAEELQDYNEKFGDTIKILPSFRNHVPPDLQHLVLQTITITIIIVTMIATVALFEMQSRKAKIKNFLSK